MSHNQAFFEPEAITVMTTAFEETLRTLGLVDRTGSARVSRESFYGNFTRIFLWNITRPHAQRRNRKRRISLPAVAKERPRTLTRDKESPGRAGASSSR